MVSFEAFAGPAPVGATFPRGFVSPDKSPVAEQRQAVKSRLEKMGDLICKAVDEEYQLLRCKLVNGREALAVRRAPSR